MLPVMSLDHDLCHRAVLARDVRHDGRFFTCVKTTGIYCRPVCPARPPKPENCLFLPSAAAAQQAGFRPCLRCRPESAPDLGAWRGASATVSRALRLIEDGALDEGDLDNLALRLGIGERQLRRLFARHLGASPVAVAQTRRVLLARQLIHQTALPMTQVALASGFGSVRRFNETFQTLYDRPPGDLRRHSAVRPSDPGISLLLPYRPPYDWDSMLAFLEIRALPGMETVRGGVYRRVIRLNGETATLAVSHVPERASLRVEVRLVALNLLPVVIARVRRMFDLAADPAAIGQVLAQDPSLAPLVAARPGLRAPGGWSDFEIAVRAVLGQQVSLKAAIGLTAKLVQTLGPPVDTGIEGLDRAFPAPDQVTPGAAAGLPIPRARAAALAGLAAAAAADPQLFDPRGDLEATVERLKALPGIGEWTAHYVALRALRESDAFLAGDAALLRALAVDGIRPTARQALARAQAWRPWRAYALMHLWTADAAAGLNRTGESDALAA
jgi:AraC family transcriptional regulator of adaptative response / DNA-3-methyladenine glycosylase II